MSRQIQLAKSVRRPRRQRRAVRYARRAVENDEHIRQQVEEIRSYCRTCKLTLGEVYVDNGKRNCPAQKRMLREIRKGAYDVLVIASLDRLSRQVVEVLRIVQAVRRAGCEVAVVHPNHPSDFLQVHLL